MYLFFYFLVYYISCDGCVSQDFVLFLLGTITSTSTNVNTQVVGETLKVTLIPDLFSYVYIQAFVFSLCIYHVTFFYVYFLFFLCCYIQNIAIHTVV